MNQGNEHSYPPSYPSNEIDPRYLELAQRHVGEMFQQRLQAFEQAAQERMAATEMEWLKVLEENRKREAALENQVNELSKRLEDSGAPSALTMHSPAKLAVSAAEVTSKENGAARPLLPSPAPLPPHLQGPSPLKPQPNLGTRSNGPASSESPAHAAHELEAVRKLGEHQLAAKDLPHGAGKLKESLELHIRVLWGHLGTTSKPPEVDKSQLARFNARFSETLSESDLATICQDSPALILPSLVQVQASIPFALTTVQSRILSGARRLEEFALEYIQAVLSKFGLTCWCPDLTQSAGSVYNSACRIIAIDTFRQTAASQQYKLGGAEKFLKNMALLISIYNNFVHHRMRKTFDRETLQPGKTKELVANNPAYQNRYRLCQSRIEFVRANGYKRYLKYLDPKATSDDEPDPEGSRIKGRPVHFIKVRAERSAAATKWIRLLDQERELVARLEGKTYRQERIRILPSEPEETAFPLLPFNMPLDYYDPAFFNSLQPGLRKKIAGISQTVGLLPDISHSFGHGPGNRPHPDERLGEKGFNKKYGQKIVAQYMLDDLDDVDAFDSDEDGSSLDEYEDDEAGGALMEE